MKNLAAVLVFALLTIAFFAGYSNYGIPQLEPAPPPTEEKLDLGTMTMDQFVALGEAIFNGKGTCTLCHTEVGGRAPLLDRIGVAADERMRDPRYEGDAATVEAYIYESMVEPSAYVVAGFGKTGTNDTESPMPDVTSGSIGLSEAEMMAVVAYLQDASGLEITVGIPDEAAEEDGEEEEGEAQREALETAEEVIGEFACGACHKVADEEGEIGPDLTAIGAKRDRSYLRRSILHPNAEIAEGFEAELMPDDYGEQLYAKELETLVDYLAQLK